MAAIIIYIHITEKSVIALIYIYFLMGKKDSLTALNNNSYLIYHTKQQLLKILQREELNYSKLSTTLLCNGSKCFVTENLKAQARTCLTCLLISLSESEPI